MPQDEMPIYGDYPPEPGDLEPELEESAYTVEVEDLSEWRARELAEQIKALLNQGEEPTIYRWTYGGNAHAENVVVDL